MAKPKSSGAWSAFGKVKKAEKLRKNIIEQNTKILKIVERSDKRLKNIEMTLTKLVSVTQTA